MSTDNIGGVAAATLDKYGEEDFFAVIVRYGLLVGAVFQFVCISAAVLMSGNDSQDTIEEEARLTDEPVQGSGNAARRLHKIRKLEKKKRR